MTDREPTNISRFELETQMAENEQTGHHYATREVVFRKSGATGKSDATAPVFSEVEPTPSEKLEYALTLVREYGTLSARFAKTSSDAVMAELLKTHDDLFTLFWGIYGVGEE